MDFGFGEKVLVIMHGLPVLDHKVHLLVIISAVRVWHRYFLTTRGAFGDCRIRSPNAPHILGHMSRVFRKFIDFFLREMEEEIKKRSKKERKFGLKEFPRPLSQ